MLYTTSLLKFVLKMSESDEQVVMGVTPSKEVKRELFKEEDQGTSVDRADLSIS